MKGKVKVRGGVRVRVNVKGNVNVKGEGVVARGRRLKAGKGVRLFR